MADIEAPPISELVPHHGASMLLDRVIAHERRRTVVGVMAGSQRWLRGRDGSTASWLAVEYMAQCVAAHEGLLALAEGRARWDGFLVRVRGLQLGLPSFPSGQQLRVEAKWVRGREGLGILSYDCEILAEGEAPGDNRLAEGCLSFAVERPQA